MVAVLAQLGSVFHLAAVKHVECAEHGELVEVASDFAPARAVTAADSRTASIRGEYALAHGHDHCPLAACRRERVRSEARTTLLAPSLQEQSAVLTAGRSAPAPAIAILDLAPKNSPPAI
ncbi:MAG TPA: hypothetical protein VFF06_25675 [Polyangia bacterium]|nr:hypothetical protein [Polyangia bacterium]